MRRPHSLLARTAAAQSAAALAVPLVLIPLSHARRPGLALLLASLLAVALCSGVAALATARTVAVGLRRVGARLELLGSDASAPAVPPPAVDGHATSSTIQEVRALMDACSELVAAAADSARSAHDRRHALAEVSGELSTISEKFTQAAQDAGQHVDAVARASHDVGVTVENLTSETAQVGSAIERIAQSTADVAEIAQQGVTKADATREVMARLGDSSAEIGNVVKLITTIADQTNLLALNATIEAARAGEAGMGFAVVAEEVKHLATETSRATQGIAERVEAIQSDTADAVRAIQEIGAIILEINAHQTTIATAIEEQALSTMEVTQGATATRDGSTAIDAGVARALESVGSARDVAEQATRASATLSRLAAQP